LGGREREVKMTQEEQDEKDFEELYVKSEVYNPKDGCFCPACEGDRIRKECAHRWFLTSRRTLREKIKSDPSIGKLEVEDWPESPDY
jgi:hypothetical protein